MQDSYSLEQMCGGSAVFPTAERTENMLMNLFMPLCLRVGSGRKGIYDYLLNKYFNNNNISQLSFGPRKVSMIDVIFLIPKANEKSIIDKQMKAKALIHKILKIYFN